jgi:DNA-binding NtrC family response regulator
LADNDRNISDLLADVLARVGVAVSRAFDGIAAREMVRRPGVRVLVCDLDMPGASGLDVLASLADLALPPAVVVISGYVDAEVTQQLRRWPFVRRVMRKPFDLLEFAKCVRELLAAERSAVVKTQAAADSGTA